MPVENMLCSRYPTTVVNQNSICVNLGCQWANLALIMSVICKIVSSQPFEFFPGETAYLYWNGPQTPITIAYVSAWYIITEIKSTLSYLILSYQKEYAIKPSSRRTANMSRRLWVFLRAFSNAADPINNDVHLLLTIHDWRIVQDVAICRLVASWSLT